MDKLSFIKEGPNRRKLNQQRRLMVLCLAFHAVIFFPCRRGSDVNFLVSILVFSSLLSVNSTSHTSFKTIWDG